MKKHLYLLSFTLLFVFIFWYGNVEGQTGSWKLAGNNLSGGEKLGSKNNFPINVYTDNIQRMIIEGSPDGFVGIGTINPTANLHVNSVAGKDALRIQVAGATKLYVHNGGGVSVGSAATPPANGLFVGGSVGIGISSPAVKLHVTGGSDAGVGGGGFVVTGTLTGANIAIDDNEIMARSNGSTSSLFLNQGGGNLIFNGTNSAGNLGIGTNTPASRLHVVGNIFATGNLDVSGSLGFGSVETFTDGGSNTIQANSNIIPNLDGTWDLGSSTRDWAAIHADAYLTPSPFGSDAKAQSLKAGMREIMKLRPISFSNGDIPRFGLIAKEVQQVLPEVTRDWEIVQDETGKAVKQSIANVSLEYDAFIPVLIKALQEQQQTIAALEERVAKMEAAKNSVSSNQMQAGNLSAGVVLEQNQPNPFSQTTIIRYSMPQGMSGVINIYDAGGSLVKSFKTNNSGQATVNADELKAGTYTYTLSVNGKLAATKKLILLK